MTPALKLNNNINFPLIGLGTSQAKPGEMEKAVKEAIDIGYRHFDSAMIYGNDQEVGTAIREKIADGYVKREDLFITNKLWNTYHRPDLVVPTCKKTLETMGLDYLDLYLMHNPIALKEGDTLFPTDETGKLIPSDVDYVDTWKAMEECVKLGLAKSIGLSNFNSQQIQRVLDVATIKPVVNQVECHPYFNQSKMIAFCKERGIVVTAYAPFGRPGSTVNYIRHDVAPLLQDTKLQEIATKRDKTVAQVILRYLIQHGVVPIPKSSNKSRLQENFDVFNFELTPVEISSIDALNSDSRIFTYSLFADLKDYPFNTEF
ncbi:aldose reductase-like isoform X1 [Zootermopsis nevadensis]|uniref:aldose reductase-like isoform X1 n=1 Tax=Zootermopsis nevadensis TaxID=136037 RepID=UPI000B8E8F10|nr:aldose reductase-like isoform X1 [Zootermopsis nevadensis]